MRKTEKKIVVGRYMTLHTTPTPDTFGGTHYGTSHFVFSLIDAGAIAADGAIRANPTPRYISPRLLRFLLIPRATNCRAKTLLASVFSVCCAHHWIYA